MITLAVIFITMGVQGSLGKVVAVIFVPSELVVNTAQASMWTPQLLAANTLPNVPTGTNGLVLF